MTEAVTTPDTKVEETVARLAKLLDPTIPGALSEARRILEEVFLAGYDTAMEWVMSGKWGTPKTRW